MVLSIQLVPPHDCGKRQGCAPLVVTVGTCISYWCNDFMKENGRCKTSKE